MEHSVQHKKVWFRIWILSVLAGSVALFYRCRYNYAAYDEAFYAAVLRRMVTGDVFLVDEWNTGQLFSFCLLPLGYFYKWIKGGTEGIILNFRYVYIVFQILVSVWMYWYLAVKKGQQRTGVFVSLLYLFSTAYGINALGYNTLQTTAVNILTLLFLFEDAYSGKKCIVLGILWTVAVLSNPYLILVFFAWGILCLLGKKFSGFKLESRTFWYTCATCSLFALIFFCFILQKYNMREILINVPHLFEEPSLVQGSVLRKTASFVYRIIFNYWLFLVLWIPSLLISLIDKNRQQNKAAYIIYGLIVWVLFSGYLCITGDKRYLLNLIHIPFGLLGLQFCFLLKRNKAMFWMSALLGILHPLMVCYASNTGILSFSSAFTSLEFTGIAALFILLGDIDEDRLSVCAAVILALFVGLVLFLRVTTVFMEKYGILGLTEQMERGPEMGIYTTHEHQEEYDAVLRLIDLYPPNPEEHIFIINKEVAGYLYADAKYGQPDSFDAESEIDWYWDYMELHPDKFPEIVYFPAGETAEKMQEAVIQRGYQKISDEQGNAVWFLPRDDSR